MVSNKCKGGVLLEAIVALTLILGTMAVTVVVSKQLYNSENKRDNEREDSLIMEALVKEVQYNYTKEEIKNVLGESGLELEKNEGILEVMSKEHLESIPKGKGISIKYLGDDLKGEVSIEVERESGEKIEERVIKE